MAAQRVASARHVPLANAVILLNRSAPVLWAQVDGKNMDGGEMRKGARDAPSRSCPPSSETPSPLSTPHHLVGEGWDGVLWQEGGDQAWEHGHLASLCSHTPGPSFPSPIHLALPS